MKRILITGANSYIGTSFEKYVSQWPEKYETDTVDMIDGSWRKKSFAGYVFKSAGLYSWEKVLMNLLKRGTFNGCGVFSTQITKALTADRDG